MQTFQQNRVGVAVQPTDQFLVDPGGDNKGEGTSKALVPLLALVHMYCFAIRLQTLVAPALLVLKIMQVYGATCLCQCFDLVKKINGATIIWWRRGIKTNDM